MDYLSQSLAFKLKKVGRYVRLYGPRRTWSKVQSRKHMQRTFEEFPPLREPTAKQIVGVIGCGNYGFSTIAYFLHKRYGRVIGGCMDINIHRAASLAQQYKVPRYSADAGDIIDDDRIRLIYIASNHASHAEYAIRALEKDKDVYIEKPHVVDVDQLVRLVSAMNASQGRVYLGFNRPVSRFGEMSRQLLSEQSGTGMYNWFVAGHAIAPDHWYFHPREGGRVLGNLCHWTDFLLRVATEPRFPITITPNPRTHSGDIAVTYSFGDGSTGVITFSEKADPFEGVKEHFIAHRGELILKMDDFETMTVEVADRKSRYRNLFRDHGHRTNILNAFRNSTERLPYDRKECCSHMANTAWLFLKTKKALDDQCQIVLQPFNSELKANVPQRLSA